MNEHRAPACSVDATGLDGLDENCAARFPGSSPRAPD